MYMRIRTDLSARSRDEHDRTIRFLPVAGGQEARESGGFEGWIGPGSCSDIPSELSISPMETA